MCISTPFVRFAVNRLYHQGKAGQTAARLPGSSGSTGQRHDYDWYFGAVGSLFHSIDRDIHVSHLIHVNFGTRKSERAFSADVYSFDMKKYRFQVVATSLTEAYDAFVAEAELHGVKAIRCIAIYLGQSEHRNSYQLPAKVWQQYDSAANGLVEY